MARRSTSGRIGSGHVRAVAAIVPMIPCSADSRSRSCSHHDGQRLDPGLLHLDAALGDRRVPGQRRNRRSRRRPRRRPSRSASRTNAHAGTPATIGRTTTAPVGRCRRRGPAEPATTPSIDEEHAEPDEAADAARRAAPVSAAPRSTTARAPSRADSSPTRRGPAARGAVTTARAAARGCRRRRGPTARSC